MVEGVGVGPDQPARDCEPIFIREAAGLRLKERGGVAESVVVEQRIDSVVTRLRARFVCDGQDRDFGQPLQRLPFDPCQSA